MKTGLRFSCIVLGFVFCVAALAPAAYAESRRGVRSVRGSSLGRSIGRGLSGSRGSRGLQGLGGLLDSGRRHSSMRNGSRGLQGLGNLLDLGRRYGDWRGGYGDWYRGGYHDRHRADDEYADAIRDAAIANAVVGVVGIIAGAATAPYAAPREVYVEPAPQYAPAPSYTAPQYVPVPEYRVERVLVQEGRYEEYQVWVPDTYDARTGEMIMGHYVTRQRYVPEVWEERHVRVR